MGARHADELRGSGHLGGTNDEPHRERGSLPVAAVQEVEVGRRQRQAQPRASSASMRAIFSTRAT
jgi:hypothetical protein